MAKSNGHQRTYTESRRQLIRQQQDEKMNVTDYFGDYEEHLTGEEIANRLPEAERNLAAFILRGGEIPEDINMRLARSVLRQLAGTAELEDHGVMERFGMINQYISGVALSGAIDGAGSNGTNAQHVRVKVTNIPIKYSFRPDNGACAGTDPEMFYPGRGESTREAKAVCAQCGARDECLDHALANNERFGVWGGTSERQRRRLRRTRRISASVLNGSGISTPQNDLDDEDDIYYPSAEDLQEAAVVFG